MKIAMSAKTLHSATEMLDAGVELSSVEFFGISATVNEDWDASESPSESLSPEFGLKHRIAEKEFGVRLYVKIDMGIGVVNIDLHATYTFPEEVEILTAGAAEFANKVGVMALIPYARQAIADVSQRVFGDPIVLPILKQGDLEFDLESE